jgi:hypothetical protein
MIDLDSLSPAQRLTRLVETVNELKPFWDNKAFRAPHRLPCSNDGLNRMHKIARHLSAAANEIDELGPNAGDCVRINDQLRGMHISLWELRDACDLFNKGLREEEKYAEEWEKKYLSLDNRIEN